MLILKRLSIWLCETSLEALLLGVVLVILSGDGQRAYLKELAVAFVWVSTMFFSTGYLLTTGLARAMWQPRKTWPYSILATALFFIHFEILNHAAGGIFEPSKRTVIRVAGACIVLVCTLIGTLLLQKWVSAEQGSQVLETR